MKQTVTVPTDDGPLVADVWTPPTPNNRLPVLLVHGWGGSGRYWQSLVERLGDEWTFVVPDLPGVGRSMSIRRARDMADHAASIERLLAHLDLPRVHIVAHSMGAGVTMLLAARRPELIDRLVLTSVSLPRSDRERYLFLVITLVLELQLWVRAAWMANVPLLRRLSARRYFYQVPNNTEALREGFLDYLHMDRATAVKSARFAAGRAVPDAARRVRAPTLLVAGRHDHAMPVANVEYTARVIPRSRVRWIEQCGHLPMVEQPDEYAASVRDFLRAADDPAPVMDQDHVAQAT